MLPRVPVRECEPWGGGSARAAPEVGREAEVGPKGTGRKSPAEAMSQNAVTGFWNGEGFWVHSSCEGETAAVGPAGASVLIHGPWTEAGKVMGRGLVTRVRLTASL